MKSEKGITAQIIADSINTSGNRLTTYILQYQRFVHSELLTHRVFSKNAASSRAIPIEKMIQQVIDNPAIPVWWGKNQSGMSAREELDSSTKKKRYITNRPDLFAETTDIEEAKRLWLYARDEAISHVKYLNQLGLHKQIANRILEPWFHIRVILSGTEFENFFALRVHEDAQPEIQALASKMLEEYNKSTPKLLQPGMWHIPFGDRINEDRLFATLRNIHGDDIGTKFNFPEIENEAKMKVAVARCARISYHNYEGKDDYKADIKLCDRLFGSIPRHLSPTEHVAQAIDSSEFIGNFKGFKQYRKFFEDENLKDSRVIKK